MPEIEFQSPRALPPVYGISSSNLEGGLRLAQVPSSFPPLLHTALHPVSVEMIAQFNLAHADRVLPCVG